MGVGPACHTHKCECPARLDQFTKESDEREVHRVVDCIQARPAGCEPPQVLCDSSSGDSSLVELIVGGHRFTTSRKTLSSCEKLVALTAGPPTMRGSYFIDRDGRHFNEILNFLRDGITVYKPPSALRVCEEIRAEAIWYGLPELANRVYVGAPIADNEERRLARLAGLGIVGTDTKEVTYDNITAVVAMLLGVPIALVSLVGEEFQWFKSKVGITAESTPRCTSFCAYSFTPPDKQSPCIFMIEDARADDRFKTNALVTGPPNIVFYAGSPLVTSDGLRLGALCVIDRQPRSLTPSQSQILINFGHLTVQEIERAQLKTGSYFGDGDEEKDFDFSGGSFRRERMRESLEEFVFLVKVHVGKRKWPVVYANKTWCDFTGINIIPPNNVDGPSLAEGPGLIALKMKNKAEKDDFVVGMSLWDWFTLEGMEFTELASMIDTAWLQNHQRMFDITGSAYASFKTDLTPSRQGRVKVCCRLFPADKPLDVGAAIVSNVRPPGWKTPPRSEGQLYFAIMKLQAASEVQVSSNSTTRTELASMFARKVTPPTMVRSPAKLAMKSPIESLISRTNSKASFDSGRGASWASEADPAQIAPDKLSALQPPKSPFLDVRLVRQVGKGSFGTVFCGLWVGSLVAVKVIEHSSAAEKNKLNPLMECHLACNLAHPNVVQTFKFSTRSVPMRGSDRCETWIVQEWCDRDTLTTICATRRQSKEAVLEALEILIEICSGGSYLHSRGVIHGDLTANNVLLKTEVSPKGFVCKICDFGLARILEYGENHIQTMQLGTLTHMPPELFGVSKRGMLSAKADVYSAGVLLWQCITGDCPYGNLSAAQIVVQVAMGKRLSMPEETSDEIKAIFLKSIATEPEDRPEFNEMFTMLKDYYDTICASE